MRPVRRHGCRPSSAASQLLRRLSHRHLTSVPVVPAIVCASPTYLATRTSPTVPEDLASRDVISFGSVSAQSTWRFWSRGNEVTVSLGSRLSGSTIDAAIEAGLAGAGILGALSYQVVDLVRGERLRLLLGSDEATPRPVHLVYDRQKRLPLKLRAVFDLAVPRLRERLLAAAL